MKNLSRVLLISSVILCFIKTKTFAAYTYNWTGSTSTAWELAGNWNRTGTGGTSTYPGQGGSTTDIVRIGVSGSYTTQPLLSTSVTVASLTIGAATTTTLTINGALTILGDFVQKNNGNANGVTTNLTGSGSIACTNFYVGDSTLPPVPLAGLANATYLTKLNFSSLSLTINQNFYLTTTASKTALLILVTVFPSANVNNPIFNFNSGAISVGNMVQTVDSNDANIAGFLLFAAVSNSAQFLMNPATGKTSVLNLAGANPISLDGSAGYIDLFGSAGGASTVNYKGTVNQEVYTTSTPYSFTRQSPTGLDKTTSIYQNLTFSGSATKTSDIGNLTVGNNFNLAAGSETVDLATNSPTVTIGGNLVTNTGTTINQGGVNVMTVAGTSTNAGTINQIGSSNITFTGAVSNSLSTSVISQSSIGTIIAANGVSNSGSITQLTGATGGMTITGTLNNSGTVTQTGGNIIVNGDVINSGTLTLGIANLGISGNYTNSGTYTQSTGTTLFNGSSAQTLQGGSGTGTQFNTVNFSGAGLKSMTTGNFSVTSTSVLTMIGSSNLAVSGNLTLLSDANGSATVAALPSGAGISGNVNVQRYLSGGLSYSRGYRLMSSPVTQGSGDYSINYLINSAYLTGTTGTAGGFDKTGNPTLYLYRENLAPMYTTFLNSNYRGINTISGSPNYLIDQDAGTFNIPVGNGYLFFFRGDRNVASLTAETTTTYVPTNTVFATTGTLNQGQITVNDWYTPGSTILGYSTTPGNDTERGFNLVGNPYASSINWDNYSSTLSSAPIYAPSVSKFIYVLDLQSKNYGVYAAGTASKTGTNNSTNIIVSGQGFFVQDTCSCAKLVFQESAKVNTQVTGLNLLMTAKSANLSAGDPYFRLQLGKDSVNIDEMIVSFSDAAKATYSRMEDAKYKSGEGSGSLASITPDNFMLSVNALPLPKQMADTIRLTVHAKTDGIYQLNMKELAGIPQLYEVWLMDSYRKDSLDMRANNTYAFNVYQVDSSSYGAHRFTLIIRQNPAEAYRLLNFAASKLTNAIQVKLIWKTQFEQNYTNFTVQRSIDGGKTYQAIGSLTSNGIGSYNMMDKNPTIGQNLYRLKQQDINSAVTYSNLVPIQYSNNSNGIFINNVSVYPNPAVSIINVYVDSQSLQTPSYNIDLVSSSGVVVKHMLSNQPSWQGNISSLLPGTYIIKVVDNKSKSTVGETKFVKM